eukprot:2264582-Prymnesium_polylepis.1
MRKAKRRVSGDSHTPSQPPALGVPVSVAAVRPAPVARGSGEGAGADFDTAIVAGVIREVMRLRSAVEEVVGD